MVDAPPPTTTLVCSMLRTDAAMVEKAALALNRSAQPEQKSKGYRNDSRIQQMVSTSTGCHLLMDLTDTVTYTGKTEPHNIYMLSFECRSRSGQSEMVREVYSSLQQEKILSVDGTGVSCQLLFGFDCLNNYIL